MARFGAYTEPQLCRGLILLVKYDKMDRNFMIYMNMLLYDLSFRWGKNSYFQGREGASIMKAGSGGPLVEPEQGVRR